MATLSATLTVTLTVTLTGPAASDDPPGRFSRRSAGRSSAVLNGFGDMMFFDTGAPLEVRQRSGYAQNSMVGSGGKCESFDTVLQQAAGIALEVGDLLEAPGRESRVGAVVAVTFRLQGPRLTNAVTDRSSILGRNGAS